MMAFTNAHDRALEEHLAWCRQIIEENEEQVAQYKAGALSLGNAESTRFWMAKKVEQTEALQRFVAAFKPAEFQSQVKG